MSRHHISITPRGITTLRNVRTDETGEPMILLDKTEVKKVTIDLADFLETGETISSATIEATGCTASITTASPYITMTLSNPTIEGHVTLTITTSTSEVIRPVIRVREPERTGDERLLISDYA